ncbi:hypothetical protein GCM10022419_069910 [Nonomuraea rosea]|uniref:Glycosyl hydrolase family 32 n=1 Tax=Nonomuraea rosea TaxID=638574 RepID=A0ABP6Y7A6_9ACTN
MGSTRSLIAALLVPLAVVSSLSAPAAAAPDGREYAANGEFHKIYTPPKWDATHRTYINDHSIIRGHDGTWHMFGITGPENPDGLPSWEAEDQIAHATSKTLTGQWDYRAPVLYTGGPGYAEETHVWAPHVIEPDGAGTYYMFYAGGGTDLRNTVMSVAKSTDLWNWKKVASGPLFRDGENARDPYVAWVDDHWVMYYTATSDRLGTGRPIVAYRTSTDLIHWSGRGVAFADGFDAGFVATESPQVIRRGAWWYLFIGPRAGYNGTDVYRSRDPLNFRIEDFAGRINAHATEVVQDDATGWWVTQSGWWHNGLSVAPLIWGPGDYLRTPAANPAIARNASGLLEMWVVAGDRSGLYHRRQTGPDAWTAWERFGEALRGVPTVGQNADGRLEVFAVTPDGGAMTHRYQLSPNGPWSAWEPFGGPAAGAPTVARAADGRLEVFAVGPNGGNIAHRYQLAPNGAWSEWNGTFGGPAGSVPAVGQNADGRLELFALAPDGAGIAHRWQVTPNGAWSDWEPAFGGPAGGVPVVGRNADGRLEVFVTAPGGAGIAHRWQLAANGGWSGWESFGDATGGSPSVGTGVDGRLHVFALSPGNAGVYLRKQAAPSGAWLPWEQFGGPAGCVPALGNTAGNQLQAFAISPEGTHVFSRRQTGPTAWTGWTEVAGTASDIPCGYLM